MNKTNTTSDISNYKIFVVILNYNGFEDTKKCVNSLLKCTYKNLTVVMVDNASNDNSRILLQKEFPSIKLIQSKENLGYAGGMNIGIKYALENNSDFILIANNDLIFDEYFFEPMLMLFESNKSIGVISPKINHLENKSLIYSAGLEFSVLKGGGVNKFRNKNSVEFATENREISFADGACLLVKSEVFKKMGMFDPIYFMYFEDLEFSYRIKREYTISYCSHSIVYHKCGAGIGWTNYSALYYYYYTRNRFLFFNSIGNIFYSVYIILFSVLNGSVKLILLFRDYISRKEKKEKIASSIKALLNGLKDGFKILINIR